MWPAITRCKNAVNPTACLKKQKSGRDMRRFLNLEEQGKCCGSYIWKTGKCCGSVVPKFGKIEKFGSSYKQEKKRRERSCFF